jgi:hypothetical protein
LRSFFAEKGPGITKDAAYTVENVWDFCIPRALNGHLTMAQFSKRMKLSFSTTRATCVLPENSVDIVPDFKTRDIQELDGCGLLSRAALNAIWQGYTEKESSTCEKGFTCPFTGFQGRLGGFKGTWVLDESLGPEIVVHCRTSQLKYNTPQKALLGGEPCSYTYGKIPPQDIQDVLYNTMEVNSWDKKLPVQLNTRIIQVRNTSIFITK